MLALIRRQTRMLRVMAWTSGVVSWASLLERFRIGQGAQDVDGLNARYKMHWVRGAVHIVGLDVHVVRGIPSPDVERGRLIIANHRTPLDILALLSLFGGYFLANHRVARAPVVGRGAHRIGTVFVDREDRKSGVAAIRTMRRLLEQKRTMIVFPEGTTFEGDEVRPFKGGAITAAGGLPVDIVPVGIVYAPGHELGSGRMGDHVRSFLGRRRTSTWVAIGDPIPVPQDRKGLDAVLRDRVQELVAEARRASIAALGARTEHVLSAEGTNETETG
ncbi:MAG: 1-acyl-sn-glycerol-3-phosphate acyltransferase [Myxococcota bacterium]|nr:1-acyl-sn-glycerol-3-phosphate acyltransferase [Myxococcota bacterium]